jgi:acetyl esterase/lipase
VSRLSILQTSLVIALGVAGIACGQTAKPSKELEIRSKVGVWRPAAGATQVPLWPDGAPLARPDTGDRPEETGNGSGLVGGRQWHWAANVTRPTMTIYRPKGRNTGTTLLVLPGGGFSMVAMDLEGTEICDWVVAKGMTCALLKYRAPQQWPMDEAKGRRRRPEVLLSLQDAQRAMGLLRQDAAAYHIRSDRIGVIGFSAGAYLAADISNTEQRTYAPLDAADRQPARPDFAVIAYTGRLWDTSNPRTDLGLAPWAKISPKAPPTLLIHAMNDEVDDIRHPMAYALALHDAGVPVDLRIYAKGGHAYGMRPTEAPITREWPGEVEQWLRGFGML